MRNMRRTLLTVLLCGAAAALLAQTQQRPYGDGTPLNELVRFDGVLTARTGPLAGAQVAVRHWQIRNAARVEIPHRGFLIVQVRAGEVFATVGGERRERNPDEFFTVAAGERLLIETGDDSAVLHTVDTADAQR